MSPADPELDPALFDFDLPHERIAQRPAACRDQARLLIVNRSSPNTPAEERRICELTEVLAPGDLLVVNTTRVLAARLRGRKTTGGAVEALLLGEDPGPAGRYQALLKQAGRARVGVKLCFEGGGDALEAEIIAVADGGEVTLQFFDSRSPYAIGETPLPPYIRRSTSNSDLSALDEGRYQTVFAKVSGAIAAPTAGLHLTRELLDELRGKSVETAEVVLHVGVGTFRPLREEDLQRRKLHSERYQLPAATVDAIDRTRSRGGRVVAVGTTTTRVLESCADEGGRVCAQEGETDLFLYPGCRFQVVDALLTNFHLPRSSLLYLVAAFAGRERILAAYRQAIEAEFRFYSYGDAMLIL